MSISPISALLNLLPSTPSIFLTALRSTLPSSRQDLRTAVTVATLRALIAQPRPIGLLQAFGLRDPGERGRKGEVVLVKVAFPVVGEEENGVGPREAVRRAVVGLDIEGDGDGDDFEGWEMPENKALEGEWTAYSPRGENGKGRGEEEEKALSEKEKYVQLMEEVKEETVVLYFHGGAHFMMDPCSHRIPVAHICKKSGFSRAFSVRYRLSPQNPFPAALLDALTAYLSLLSPPPGSLHTSIPPSRIVLAGDSAGGNLCLSLTLLLLTLPRIGIESIRFHGRDVPVAVPAGLAMSSPWCDISGSLPSVHTNAAWDYLPEPAGTLGSVRPPPDEIWPAKPPRAHIFVRGQWVVHPLVSPVAASKGSWKGGPPVYMCVGNELLEDEVSVLGRRMSRDGVVVKLDGYEGMPHCFNMIFPGAVEGRDSNNAVGEWVRDCGRGKKVDGGASWTKALSRPLERRKLELDEVAPELDDEKVDELLKIGRVRYVKREEELAEEWKLEKEKDNSKTKAKL